MSDPEPKQAKKIEMIVTAAARGTKIIVDGKVIPYIRRAELILDARDASVLKLELLCLDGATVTGEVPVEKVSAPWRDHELEISGAMQMAVGYLRDSGAGGQRVAEKLREALDLLKFCEGEPG